MEILSRAGAATPTDVLAAALDYHARGWCVIPAEGKRACTPWRKFQTKRPTEEQIRNWFGSGEATNIAIVLGDVSGGLVCRDFDQTKSYVAWSQAHPDLAKTLPTVWTPRGRHVYCRAPVEQDHGPGKAYLDLGDGEMRLKGCYCVAPPSKHPAGFLYRWLNPPTPILRVVDLDSVGLCRKWLPEAADEGEQPSPEPPTRRVTEHTEAYGADESKPKQAEAISTLATSDQKRAIRDTLPKGPGQRNRCLFDLVRRLKAIPELAEAPGRDLEPIVRQWHKLALSTIRTRDYYVTLSEFLTAWDSVRFPEGCDAMAIMLAATEQEELPACAVPFEDPRMRRLIAICRVLQRHAGDGEYYLSCRKAGELLGISHKTAAIWLRLLEQLGIIRTERKGDQSTGRASRFRYLGEL